MKPCRKDALRLRSDLTGPWHKEANPHVEKELEHVHSTMMQSIGKNARKLEGVSPTNF